MKKRSALLAILTLPILAACEDGNDDSDAQSPSVMSTIASEDEATSDAETTATSGDEGSPNDELPHAEGDPCEEYQGSRTSQCETVGWADLNNDGKAEPIGIATTGAPALAVTTVVDGTTASYSPKAGNPSNLPPLGPDVGSMESRRHAAFVGAFEMTGEGAPEIVLWVDKGGFTDTFQVLRFNDGEFQPLDTPNPGLYGGGADWASTVFGDLPSYRCTGESDAPLESVFESRDSVQAQKIAFDSSTSTFELSSDKAVEVEAAGERPTVGLDCDDVAEHADAPKEQSSGPGLRCPMGRDEPVAQSDDVGELLEAEVQAGDLNCDDVETMWTKYDSMPKTQQEHGRSLIVDFGDYTCSTGSVLAEPGEAPKGSCSAMDESWKFTVGSR